MQDTVIKTYRVTATGPSEGFDTTSEPIAFMKYLELETLDTHEAVRLDDVLYHPEMDRALKIGAVVTIAHFHFPVKSATRKHGTMNLAAVRDEVKQRVYTLDVMVRMRAQQKRFLFGMAVASPVVFLMSLFIFGLPFFAYCWAGHKAYRVIQNLPTQEEFDAIVARIKAHPVFKAPASLAA